MTEPADVLTRSTFHKVMVFFHRPVNWPAWLVLAVAALMTLLAGSGWWLLTRDLPVSLLIVVALYLFMLGDAAVLQALPRRGISFGPWKGQLFSLALPRVLAMLLLAVAAVWLGVVLSVGLALLVQLLASVALGWGALIEPAQLRLTHLVVSSDRLPADARPWRLLHITDLHLERPGRREAQLLDYVRTLQPDAIFITGDYLNLSYQRDPRSHDELRRLLGQLAAPYGVYATLGSMAVDLRDVVPPLFRGLPLSLLRCEAASIGTGENQLLVLGLDCTHHLPTDARRLEAMLANALAGAAAPADLPRILLYHSPELMPQATKQEIDLYLCGHTHGGQVRLPLIGPLITSSQLGRQYVMGHYRCRRTHLYVSRGVGLEGLSAPRVRFLCRPEVTLITLTGNDGRAPKRKGI
jgi:predicted MPP superfamily phosphohydrolase